LKKKKKRLRAGVVGAAEEKVKLLEIGFVESRLLQIYEIP